MPAGVPGGVAGGVPGTATASLVLGLLFCVPLIGIVAIGVGIVALRQIARSNGSLGGRGRALGGIALGGVQTAATVVVVAVAVVAGPDIVANLPTSNPSDVLDVGECLDIDVEETDDFTLSRRNVVPCEQPHSAQYAGSVELTPASDGAYPGEDSAFDEATQLCLEEFERLTGRDLYDDPELDLYLLVPNDTSWNLLDERTADCFIISFLGTPLVGSALP